MTNVPYLRPVRSLRRERAVTRALLLLPPTLWAIAIVVPIVYLLLISVRTTAEYRLAPLALPAEPHWDNYVRAWVDGNLGQAYLNNIIITVVGVAAVVLFGSMAGYAIARSRRRVGKAVYLLFIAGIVVPVQLGLPALFKIWASLGLVDTLPGAILVHIGSSLPFAVFLYSGFVLSVPAELEESGRVDGAGDLRVFFSIVFPLLRPVTATIVILTSIGVWNDLLVSLFFLPSSENYTLARATIGFLGAYTSDVPVVFACAVLTVVPIIALFVALQRYFVSGLTQGALK